MSYNADDETPWQYRWIALQEDAFVLKLLDRLHLSPDQPISVSIHPRKTAAAFRQMMNCLKKGDVACDIQASAYTRLILAGYIQDSDDVRSNAQTDNSIARRQVEQAVRYLSLQYYQEISIEAIAHDMGYHRTHFCKIFKQITGLSPYQYLTQVRMKQATRLLKQFLTVQQVAAAVGYNDALYFSKQFKRFYGVAPSLYIRRKHEKRPD